RDFHVTGVQTCALPISRGGHVRGRDARGRGQRWRRGHGVRRGAATATSTVSAPPPTIASSALMSPGRLARRRVDVVALVGDHFVLVVVLLEVAAFRAHGATHPRSLLDAQPRGDQVSAHVGACLEAQALLGDDAAVDPPRHAHALSADGAEHDTVRRHRHGAFEDDVSLDTPDDFQVAPPRDIADDDAGGPDDRHSRHSTPSVQSPMSTLPRNVAPSAMVSRGAFTSPTSRPPASRSTRSVAVTLAVTLPATLTVRPLTSASTAPREPSSTLPFVVTRPRTRPSMCTSTSLVRSPSIVSSEAMMVEDMVSSWVTK